ncbi:hypothetical protein GCM10010216_22030 [Streptomyces flaveolus]|nr:hypothetical protein GCM10010216_22030 [Streptomyces flaveolus]
MLTGKAAVVTGGSRGIGRTIVLRLARVGATVVFNYAQNLDAADEVVQRAEKAGGKVIVAQLDLAEPSRGAVSYCRTPAQRSGHSGQRRGHAYQQASGEVPTCTEAGGLSLSLGAGLMVGSGGRGCGRGLSGYGPRGGACHAGPGPLDGARNHPRAIVTSTAQPGQAI